MINSRLISNYELEDYLLGSSKVNEVEALLKQQNKTWTLSQKNYNDLKSVKKKEFDFGSFKIYLQFNPGRIISSSAKVDSKSIQERPCFLCYKNLPSEQKGILFDEKYLLLVNPFPIFEEHFTIPIINHQAQEIESSFFDMLSLAKNLGEKYTLFYNGPRCGASAPDHLHFQASPKNSMPVEVEIDNLIENSIEMKKDKNIVVYSISNYLRNIFFIESGSKEEVAKEFYRLYELIQTETNSKAEPLLNVIVSFDEKWRVFIFPRKAHRPSQFFAEGNAKILLSPAAVDFGGLLITPREEDFDKLTKNDIEDIFRQTTLDDAIIHKIIQKYSVT